MKLLLPLVLVAGTVAVAATARAAGKKKAVRGVLLDDILTDEEADAPPDDDSGTFIDYESGIPAIETCVNSAGQVFTFDALEKFGAEFGYKIFWSPVTLSDQLPKNEYTLNPYSRAFDSTTCQFMIWSLENKWLPDLITNAELVGWKANQDLANFPPPPFFPQF